MKKNLFFYAMAFCVAVCNVACSSDDNDDNNNNNSEKVIPAPAKAANAVAYTIPTNAAPAKNSDLINKDGIHITASLTGINITESEKAIIEVTTKDNSGNTKLKYATFDAELDGDTYTIKDGGKVIGTITKRNASRTRGTSNVALVFHLKFTLNSITGTLEFEAEDPVTAKAMEEYLSNSDNLTSIARTWTIERMKLTLVFDDKKKSDASTTVSGGNLTKFIELAEDNGVNLTEKEKADLSKDIESITFDKNGQLTLTYTNKDTDVANWSWVSGSNESKLQIKLKDQEMGNKFLADNSHVEIQFYPESKKIILILSTRLESDKCNASLLINLK